MKPFGKWLADFELPSKDEPEPQIEVVIHQGELPNWAHEQVINGAVGMHLFREAPTVLSRVEWLATINERWDQALRERLDRMKFEARFLGAPYISGKTPTAIITDDLEQGDRHE